MTTRYSPRPVADYLKVYRVQNPGKPDSFIKTGPAASALLGQDKESWNLAYLSHDYETSVEHPDPNFTTHVRRTIQFVVNTGEVDLAGLLEDRFCVRKFLREPPARAVKLIIGMSRLHETPMFKAYGQGWVTTMNQRAKALTSSAPDPVESVSEAADYLTKFTGDAA